MPKRSMIVELASLSPINSTSAPWRRSLITALSSEDTDVISQKCARFRSITIFSTASLKSKAAINLSAELKKTWPTI